MEKKYYFRGLGLGIIVTAVIMGIALSGGGKKEKMTDDEVIARAKELGMIEDSRLLEPSEEGNAEDGQEEEAPSAQDENVVKKDIAVAQQQEEADSQQETEKPVVDTPESVQTGENEAAETEKPVETEESGAAAEAAGQKPAANTNEMNRQDEDVPEPETDGAKTVTIASGDGSYTVAKKLADAGVVGSATAYDNFLCANGYDKKLRPGTFEIPANASEEQVARIVTGQE